MKLLGNDMTSCNPRWQRAGNLKANIGDRQTLFAGLKFEIRQYFLQSKVRLLLEWRFPLRLPVSDRFFRPTLITIKVGVTQLLSQTVRLRKIAVIRILARVLANLRSSFFPDSGLYLLNGFNFAS